MHFANRRLCVRSQPPIARSSLRMGASAFTTAERKRVCPSRRTRKSSEARFDSSGAPNIDPQSGTIPPPISGVIDWLVPASSDTFCEAPRSAPFSRPLGKPARSCPNRRGNALRIERYSILAARGEFRSIRADILPQRSRSPRNVWDYTRTF